MRLRGSYASPGGDRHDGRTLPQVLQVPCVRRNRPESYPAEGQGIEMLPVRDAYEGGLIMDFKITPGGPDGINVEVEFYVDTWDELSDLMEYLQEGED